MASLIYSFPFWKASVVTLASSFYINMSRKNNRKGEKSILFHIFLFYFFHLGLGCDTAAVINILAHRDATQRSLIQHEYRAMYSEDLLKRLVSELHGKLEVPVFVFSPLVFVL